MATFTGLSPDSPYSSEEDRESVKLGVCASLGSFACLLVLTVFTYFLPELQALLSLLHLLYPNPLSASKPSQEAHSDLGRWEGPDLFSEMLGEMFPSSWPF